MAKEERIVLGSGDGYLQEYVSTTFDTSDVDALVASLFVEDNRWGNTKNGATLTYTPTSYTVTDDQGHICETFMTDEAATLAFGTVTINESMIADLVATGRYSTTENGLEVLKIGGLNNDNGKSYIVGFKHPDAKRGATYVIIVGKNTAELSIPFAKDSETVINPTFTAQSMDDDGTKIIIVHDTMMKTNV